MTTLAGTRLGPYDILSALGAGGMGEVYRARDSRLDRDVAIKILPPAFAADPDRLARFEREAKTLASLNHPHIAQIYGIEEVPDASGAGRPSAALVMELVPGEDLSARIARGPVPARRGAADRAADCRCARGRARARDHPPRPETRQRQGHAGRRRQGPRLRSRQSDDGQRGAPRPGEFADDRLHRHTPGTDPRHRRLHGAGAGARAIGRSPCRCLGLRRRPLRDAVRDGRHLPATRSPTSSPRC